MAMLERTGLRVSALRRMQSLPRMQRTRTYFCLSPASGQCSILTGAGPNHSELAPAIFRPAHSHNSLCRVNSRSHNHSQD